MLVPNEIDGTDASAAGCVGCWEVKIEEKRGGLGGLWAFGAPSGSSVARRFLDADLEAVAVAVTTEGVEIGACC